MDESQNKAPDGKSVVDTAASISPTAIIFEVLILTSALLIIIAVFAVPTILFALPENDEVIKMCNCVIKFFIVIGLPKGNRFVHTLRTCSQQRQWVGPSMHVISASTELILMRF